MSFRDLKKNVHEMIWLIFVGAPNAVLFAYATVVILCALTFCPFLVVFIQTFTTNSFLHCLAQHFLIIVCINTIFMAGKVAVQTCGRVYVHRKDNLDNLSFFDLILEIFVISNVALMLSYDPFLFSLQVLV